MRQIPHISTTPADKADSSILIPTAASWIVDNTEKKKHATSLSLHPAEKQTRRRNKSHLYIKVGSPEWCRKGTMLMGQLETEEKWNHYGC